MISLQVHKQINTLLYDWDALAKMYLTIQQGNSLTVQVLGSYRDEFREGAIREAKKVLQERADKIRADLEMLNFDLADLEPLRELIRQEPTDE
jgi:hypothetical protein